MRCEEVVRQLERISTGELSPQVRRAVQGHLAGCEACRAALAEIDALAGVLAGVQSPPVPAGFAPRVMAAAAMRQDAKAVAAWSFVKWWRMTSVPIHAAAAAALIIGLSIGLAMGWATASLPARAGAAVQPNLLNGYQIDYLGEAPSGSLADSYLTLVAATNEGGR